MEETLTKGEKTQLSDLMIFESRLLQNSNRIKFKQRANQLVLVLYLLLSGIVLYLYLSVLSFAVSLMIGSILYSKRWRGIQGLETILTQFNLSLDSGKELTFTGEDAEFRVRYKHFKKIYLQSMS